ncbi:MULTISPECIES: hypothetical protein [unclassified Methylobacterium]|uniref:hypothetical protein n=1 Tax=unclassified Methylobacterium TaxID=2615210 RepID=UPI00257BCC73|nr:MULTISPECIES: hypothetical protein [unclassified Methylobacterium]
MVPQAASRKPPVTLIAISRWARATATCPIDYISGIISLQSKDEVARVLTEVTMVVGFFSDDGSALYAALLVSCGLACVDRGMTVIEGAEIGRPSLEPSIKDSAAIRTELVAALIAARADESRDVAFAAPLDLLHDCSVAAHLDVAVVSGGDPMQARRAERAAGYAAVGRMVPEAGRPEPDRPVSGRPWTLQFGPWRRPVRAARYRTWRQGRGALPAARTLPVEIPLPGRSVKAAMERGLPTLEALRIGILLAATLEVAASDPDATTIEPATMADLMFPASHPTDQALAERLTGLADRLEDIERTLADEHGPSSLFPRGWTRQRRRDGRPSRTGVAGWAQEVRPGSDVSACGR